MQILYFFIIMLFYQITYADELPKWEFGFGLGGIHQSYYTGTKQTRNRIFPVPVFIYRGETLKSDDKGIRAQLFKDERYKLDMSFDYNLPIDSSDIDLRRGMDDINSLLQIGPSIEVLFKQTEQYRFKLDLPIRAVFEIGDGGVDQSGYNFSPRLAYTHYFPNTSWRSSFSIAPQFGTRAYHDIYYSVDSNDALLTRPEYAASAGYSGSRFQFAATSKNKKRLIVLFMRYDNISGTAFDDSPLVETNENITLGFIYSHYFLKSKTKVNRNN